MDTPKQGRLAAVAELGESFAGLRICTPGARDQMRSSMARHGQLTPLVAYDGGDGSLEIIDGFKRLRAARELNLGSLRVWTLLLDRAQAKAAMLLLNASQKLSEIEEGWLVRSLYREEGLTQPAIGRLLRHDKSWVSRRLLLVESLDTPLQADLQLGLLSSSSARELARLPRGNQNPAAEVVQRRGLTAHQTARLVQKLLTCSDAKQRASILRKEEVPPSPGPKPTPAVRTRAECITDDIATLTRLAGRLETRLLDSPLAAYGDSAADAIRRALTEFHGVLVALDETVQRSAGSTR